MRARISSRARERDARAAESSARSLARPPLLFSGADGKSERRARFVRIVEAIECVLQTTEKLHDELALVRKALDCVTEGMRRLNLRTSDDEPIRYELYLIFNKNVSVQAKNQARILPQKLQHVPHATLDRHVDEVFWRVREKRAA